MTNTHTVGIPPPPFSDSVDGLRRISDALSTFLRRYDELHDHLNFIKTSIDAKLPNHLLTTANPNSSTLIPSPETYSAPTIIPVPEQNSSLTANNCERSPEDSRKLESPDFSKKHEEIDVSKNPEKSGVLETDMLKKLEEIDASVKLEEADTSKKPEETDILKKPEETDASKKPEEIDISQKPEATDMAKKTKETDTSKKPALSELESLCERMCGRGIKKYVATHISDTDKLLQDVPKALKFAKDPAKLVLESIGRFFVQGSRAYVKGSLQSVGRLASVVILECFVMMSSDGIEIAKEEEEYAAKAAFDWRKRMINEGGLARADETDARGLLLLISGFGIPDSIFNNNDIRDLIRASNVKGISTALRRSIILIPKIPEVIDWMVKNNHEIEAVDIAYTFGLEDKCHPQTILTTFLHNKIKDEYGSSPQVKETIKKQLFYLKTITKCLEVHAVDPSKLFPDYKITEKIQQLQKQINELDSKASEEKSTQKRKAKEPESSRKPKQDETKRTRLNSQDNIPQDQKPIHHYNGLTQTSSSYFNGNPANDYISAYSGSSLLHRARLPEPMTSSVAIDGARGLARGGSYGWDEDSALIEKYLGRTYSRPGQMYDPQPLTTGLIGLYGGPSGSSSLGSFPGLPDSGPSVGVSGRAGPGSDLYSFADTVVENESYRGSRASGSGTVRSSYLY